MAKVAMWFFYVLAVANMAMGEYVRYVEDSRPEAGYWLARAVIAFLIGYLVFRPLAADSRRSES